MDVGMMMVFASYGWDDCSDARVWDEEIRLARLAGDLGFDCLWSAEHHFNDYSFVPDNLQLMTYLTALCPNIDLGTAAVIVPWHDPLRVAENAAVLDMLSKGRLRLGLGRGLARREFAAFRLSMDESRERFDEAAPMIINALKTGFIEGDGKYYQQPRTEIRPRPQHSFDGRIYAVASSEESVDSAAKLPMGKNARPAATLAKKHGIANSRAIDLPLPLFSFNHRWNHGCRRARHRGDADPIVDSARRL